MLPRLTYVSICNITTHTHKHHSRLIVDIKKCPLCKIWHHHHQKHISDEFKYGQVTQIQTYATQPCSFSH